MGFLANKRALIAGVASNRSIAWGIAEAMKREGAEVALSYQGERLKERVEGLAQEIGSGIAIQCDVSQDQDIQQLFMKLSKRWDHFDILVHSIGYAPADQIKGDFLDNISREGFHIAHDISTYSFPAMAKAAKPMMEGRNFALLTLSYLGADRALPNYNTMGLAKASLEAATRYMAQSLGKHGGRVNAISAGPIKTLAASGVSDFRKMLETVGNTAPIGRNITQEDVGNVAAFLCSDLAAGVTGEVVFVDGGYNIIGMHF